MLNRIEGSLFSPSKLFLPMLVIILVLSCVASSSYRGIAHDEGLNNFDERAQRLLAHQPIYDEETGLYTTPARLIYVVLIAISYKLVGINLFALHLFPYIIQIINPCLFFLVVYRFYHHVGWSFVGAIFFIFHPFNLIYLNQQHNHPVFMFFLLLMFLAVKSAVNKHPKFLIAVGGLATLLIVTRFTSGVIFVTAAYGVYIVERWKTGLSVKWLFGSFFTAILLYVACALYFDFPILFYRYYIPAILHRQADKGANFTFYELTRQGARIFLNWFFCGKFMAPFLLLSAGIGAVKEISRKNFFSIAFFLPHFLFLTLIYNGRREIISLPVATFSVPGFLLLVLSGLHVLYSYSPTVFSRLANGTWHRMQIRQVLGMSVVVVMLAFFGRSAYSLAIAVEDAQPASTMWRIIEANPPLPGNPAYHEEFIQLGGGQQFPVLLREQIYKAVLGDYRSWYVYRIGKAAFEEGLPEKIKIQADFVYHDDYQSRDRWETDRYHLEGTSPLWNEKYSGRIGAFPLGAHGTFVYKFEFPKQVDSVMICDKHTQWGLGDVAKMWTSSDGEHWTLRYNNWNVHYTQDRYYRFFEDEFDGEQTLYVKYFFKAGDKTRTGNDNRGASLEGFSIAVNYKS